MKTFISIPIGKLASSNDAAARIRASLAKDLREGNPVEIASSGDVTGQTGEQTKIAAQPGKLASSNDAAAKIRASLAKDLREGNPVEIASSGDVTGQTGEQTKIAAQPGKLASYQWYDREPQRLRDEIEGMNRFFPQFKIYRMEDGRYYWQGVLKLNVLPNGWSWEVAAIYNNDHPTPVMGGSVRVVLLNPNIDTIINALGWRPHHLLHCPRDGDFLCTTRAEDISFGDTIATTAVQTLTWAVKWLMALELVLSGDLSKAEFEKPNGI